MWKIFFHIFFESSKSRVFSENFRTLLLFLQFDKDALRLQFPDHHVFFISAKYGSGLEELLVHLREQYDDANELKQKEEEEKGEGNNENQSTDVGHSIDQQTKYLDL